MGVASRHGSLAAPRLRASISFSLAPTGGVIGYDKASAIAHAAQDRGTTLKEAALKIGWIDEKAFDEAVDPGKMARPDGGDGVSSGLTGP